jgi:hypothetical protein
MVKRGGKATEQGQFAGITVTECGRHDIKPGVYGDPSGNPVLTVQDSEAVYLTWQFFVWRQDPMQADQIRARRAARVQPTAE